MRRPTAHERAAEAGGRRQHLRRAAAEAMRDDAPIYSADYWDEEESSALIFATPQLDISFYLPSSRLI